MKNKLTFKARKNTVYFWIFTVLAVGVMVAIFLFSAENSDESSSTSGSLIRWALGVFYPGFKSSTDEAKQLIIESFQHITRKLAHGSIYALLGFLCSGAAVQVSGLSTVKKALLPWSVAVCYCITDEIHQYFVPGRSCQVTDMLIDSLGAAIGVLALLIIWKIIKYFGKRRKRQV